MKRLIATLLLAIASAAQADVTSYRATMSGPSEVPPNDSPGYGVAMIDIDSVAHTMHVMIPFHDLEGESTVAHIHCCTATPLMGTAPVATTEPTMPGFPVGVHAGMYDHVFSLLDAGTYSAGFLAMGGGTAAGAEALLVSGIAMHDAYLNIHTSAYPSGEARGFLVPLVPEPSTWAMLGAGMGALFLRRRNRRQEQFE